MQTLQKHMFACALCAAVAGSTAAEQTPGTQRARASEAQAGVIAAKLRTQGYPCRGYPAAMHDRRASKPLGAVWDLRCSNASYRVWLIPDRAAKVQHLVVWP